MINNEEQLISDEQEESSLEQTDVENSESTQSEASPEAELPEKFKGKTVAEVAEAALNAEKAMHERAVELSSIRRQQQETQAYIAQLQSQIQKQSAAQADVDPFEAVEKEWDEDPKKATIQGMRKVREQLAAEERRRTLEKRYQEGTEYYLRQKSQDADFAQREPDMAELARKYGHIVNQEYASSKEAYEILHLAARGARLSEYEKAAVERSRKQKETIKEEKRAAVSERSGAVSTPSGFADMDDFANMSPQQQLEELAKLERKLGKG
jgi:hypothetical protein